MATWPTITDDDGSNTTGTVINNTNVWTPIQSYIGGTWVDVTFAAGNFTGSGTITWTVASGDVSSNRYVEVGKTMIWAVQLDTTTVSGTGTELRITVPNSRTIAGRSHVKVAKATDNGTAADVFARAISGNTYITIERADGGNWAASTNNSAFWFTFMFEIA